MSLAQIKQQVDALSEDEQAELERHLKLLKLTRDPAWQRRAAEGRRQLEEGGAVSQEQLAGMLKARGL